MARLFPYFAALHFPPSAIAFDVDIEETEKKRVVRIALLKMEYFFCNLTPTFASTLS